MTVPDYSEERALTLELLEEFGMPMTFVRITGNEGGFDPETGLPHAPVETLTSFCGVKTQPTREEIQAGAFQDASMVVLAPGYLNQGGEPSIADKLRFHGHLWDIVEIRLVAPAESVILYKLGVKDAGSAA